MSAFERDQIERIPVAISYRIGILLVALVMLLLPLIYLCLIALVGWAVCYHTIHHTTLLSEAAASTSGRNAGQAVVLAAMVYATPIVAGGVMLLFMFKPLFSRASEQGGRRSLNPDDEPLLFDFVDRICDAVRAPKPRRIDLDCNVNASASFGGGMLSMLGNDLVLTIGMPLVAGLDLRQFAGVLAHEFGHFAQGAGMRLTYLIRSISYWFTRVVYERDHWDERLEKLSTELDFRLGWMLYLTRAAVWCTRRIEIGMARRLRKAGVRIRKNDFSIPLTSPAEIDEAEENLNHTQSRLESRLVPFEEAAAGRLYAALRIARSPEVTARLASDGLTLNEIDTLLKMFSRTNDRLDQLLQLRDGQVVLGRLLMLISGNPENAALISEIQEQMSELHDQIQQLYKSLQPLNYPFDHARADISVAEYMLKELPNADNPVEIYEAADSIGNALPPLQIRVLERLCQIAEQVETIIGLTPLGDPPEDADQDDLSNRP